MDVNELLKRYAQGKRDFSWADLTKADLVGAKLIGINLSRSHLTGACLAKADLSQANLIKANLSGANLRDANLTGSNFYKADLSGAQLDGVDLTGADLSGVDLDKINLSGAIMPDGIRYEQWLLLQHSEETQLMNESSVSTDEQLLAKPQMSANEAIVLPEMVESTLDRHSKRKLTARELFNKETLYPFVPLLLGYFLFGQLLTIDDAPLIAWIVAWVGSLIWLIDESLTWFVPLTGAIAVMGSVSMSIVSIVVAGTITLMLIGGMMVLDFGIRKAIKDGLWLGGLAAAFVLMANWFFDGSNAFNGGGIMLRDTFYRPLILLFAIVAVAIGSMSWKTMEFVGFTKTQTIQTFASVTGFGLFCGWVIEMLF
jgi:hypothetical protein